MISNGLALSTQGKISCHSKNLLNCNEKIYKLFRTMGIKN